MEPKDLGKTSTGIQANVAGLLCYVVGFVTGIVFFMIEKENKFVRFHAMQSIITFGGLFVISIAINIFLTFIPFVVFAFGALIGLLQLVLWVVLMVKAYQGATFKLPITGELAEKYV